MEYAALLRMPVFPCKYKCCYYKLRGPIFATFITCNLRGPEGCEGIDCISNPKNFLIQILVDMEAMQDHAKAWTTRVRSALSFPERGFSGSGPIKPDVRIQNSY